MSPLTTTNCSFDFFFLLAALSAHVLFSISKPHLKLPSRNSRRFLIKTPHIVSMSKSPLHFSSPQSLSNWLKPRLPSDSFSSWGTKPGTKNVHNLWLELSQGETSLADSTPPIRTVHVATIKINSPDGSKTLLESHQELSDGSIRTRLRPLSEKMKPGESIDEAVVRAVREELGSVIQENDVGNMRIVPGSYEKKVEERASASYPGLPACYVLHSVEVRMDGLPEGEFCTEEEEYGDCTDVEVSEKAVFVKKHFWKWVSNADSV